MEQEQSTTTTICESGNTSTLLHLRVIQHLQNPQNLITYLVLTAWSKYMGIASSIPTITIG